MRCKKLVLAMLGLLLLQQAITFMDGAWPMRQEQRRLSETLGVTPAALFYTDVDAALDGSRSVSRRITTGKIKE